jgi:hypothetical protein
LEIREKVEDSLTVGVYEYTEPIFPVVPGLLVNVGAHLAETVAGTTTVQFFQLDKVPAIEVALIEREYDPAAVGVPDMVVPDQVAQEGLETAERADDSLTDGVYEYVEPINPVAFGLLVNVGAHLAETVAGTTTVQFFQLDNVPAIEVALIEREYDPAAVGVPDKVVPDQATPAETTDRVEDSLTVGVYEYTEPIFPVVLGLLVNVGAHLAVVSVESVVAPGDTLLNPSALPTPEHDLKEMLGILDGLNKNPIPYWGPNVPSPLTVPAGFCPLLFATQLVNATLVVVGAYSI